MKERETTTKMVDYMCMQERERKFCTAADVKTGHIHDVFTI